MSLVITHVTTARSKYLYPYLIFAAPWKQRQTAGVDAGPPEWRLHRIILFFLYSSSLLCSEPTHVFGRTRWLTLANGNQKTSESNPVVSCPSLECFTLPQDQCPFSLETSPCCTKKLLPPGLSEVRLWLSQAAVLIK